MQRGAWSPHSDALYAQVYHKPAETFVSRTRLAVAKAEDLEAERAEDEDGGGGGGDESTGAPSTSGEVRTPALA